ncbi:hypothetical protein MMC17_002272 [Xylographa soralifera]|nr:hypothetical protein [Xylographa soralifera]
MDPKNLQTASEYVNNLLLSRGLLRNGTPIEFAKPSKAEGGANATMAQIINLVHDMVLRRDRETDTLSSLSHNMQNLRSTAAQQSQVISRLETRSSEFERQLALSVAQERAAKAGLRSAENRNRALREEMAKLKLSVAQIRGQCANDMRKRDGELKRLKRHLEGRRGQEGNRGQVGVVVVTPGTSKMPIGNGINNVEMDTKSPGHSLKEDTNEFLTQLSQNLSNENDALISLVRTTLATLRSLQALPDAFDNVPEAPVESDPNVILTMPPSYERLATDIDDVLEQLRTLLTNPSFVSLEEVEIREDEIIRLREGWDKMEARWREAVTMMDGWRKRMMETGDTINLEDLRRGLDLGGEIVPPAGEHQEESSALEGMDDSILSGPVPPEDADEGELAGLPSPEPRPPHLASSSNNLGIGLFPAPSILQPASGNRRRSRSPQKISPRAVASSSSDAVDLLDANNSSSSPAVADTTPSKSRIHDHWVQVRSSFLQTQQRANASQDSPNGRPLSIHEKLESAQREAEEARKKDARARSTSLKSAIPKAKSRPGRRRSTLSPQELEGLLGL